MRLAGKPWAVGNLGNIQAATLRMAQQTERSLQALFQNKTMGLRVFQGKQPVTSHWPALR